MRNPATGYAFPQIAKAHVVSSWGLRILTPYAAGKLHLTAAEAPQ
jgi:hypothetical protein